MKNALIVLSLLFAVSNAFSQSAIELTTATTLSPFALATKLLETGTVVTLSPYATSINLMTQGRGVAGREQLRDDLVTLNDEMITGKITKLEEVNQPALKELFLEIASNQDQMESINSSIPAGSQLQKIATAVTLSLLTEK